MTASPIFFAHDKALRDARCVEKDAIVQDVISRLSVTPDFAAVVMPAAHGPEVELLAGRGVSLGSMFAIERSPAVRKVQEARGLRVPYRAMEADHAIDHVPLEWAGRVGFCYLDFLGRPSTPHLETIRKVMRLGLLGPGACLLVTLGVNRGDSFSCPVATSQGEFQGAAYSRAAVSWARGMQPKSVRAHEYSSVAGRHVARFLTTEMWF